MIALPVLIFLLMSCTLHYWYSRRRLRYLASKLPGPPTVPILGNSLQFIGSSRKIFQKNTSLLRQYGLCCRVWLGPILIVTIGNPQDVEIVLRNTKNFDKGWFYNVLKAWLGNGLITSKGDHWHKHRKLITPTFHFKILEQFVPIFESNCNILLKKLKDTNGGVVNISEYMELYSLDAICETAMGFQPHGQIDHQSPYVEATKRVSEIMCTRIAKAWLSNDYIFCWTSLARELKDSLKIIHDTSTQIVRKKLDEIKLSKEAGKVEDDDIGLKKKTAFLDHLLLNATVDDALTIQDIREEVDTFLFAGHDSTTSLLSFSLFALGHHPEIQEKAFNEVQSIMGENNRNITYNDVSQMKYIERCIMETLRVYATVAAVGRSCTKEIQMSEHVLPAGCLVLIPIMKMHRNPEYFPNPKVFDPDRFLPENIAGKHPYSFIPFSAGPRNCIGQKYGMVQAKFVLASILRQFEIISACQPEDLRIVSHIVTKSANGIPIKFLARNKLNTEI